MIEKIEIKNTATYIDETLDSFNLKSKIDKWIIT